MNVIMPPIETIVMICANESCRAGRPKLFVPREMVKGDRVRDDVKCGDYNGFFVSSCHNVFCKRECWAIYCDD
jgi:hypothetical protein